MVLNGESVKRGLKSGWADTIRVVNGDAFADGSGAVEFTTSSMLMDVKAITQALRYIQAKQYRRGIIFTDSISTVQNSTMKK